MNRDLDGDEKVVRKSDRAERVEAKAKDQRTERVRPRADVLADRLTVPQEVRDAYPDCVFFWENDEMGRVQIRVGNGWEVCKFPSGGIVQIPVGVGNTTSNLQSVLLCLPREWYEEDIARQEAESKTRLDSLRRKPSEHGVIDGDGLYAARAPDGTIGFSQKVGSK